MEKLLRSYSADHSKLLDVTRCQVVFERFEDLTNCLGIMITDDLVRVERVKNRLSMAYNAKESAGYRDVCVNLRNTTQTAVALGVEQHICEVQLLLKDFSDLRTHQGHSLYVRARNHRGC
uniref:Uncharacterized protein n=1 Tax=Hemiselmis andersenii TaxID=464988 RepID=A0A6T8JAZ6_HEMAN|mmetsp:Transcript_19984/g.45920  ORF Transcript_19984/g.45920 Transcript_19984/m.45920 type:complete len:120 (+) Transcript_19984:1-360(+)